MRSRSALLPGIILSFALPGAAQVQWDAPDGIDWRTGTILSEGTRLAAEIFSLDSNSGTKLPCLLMAHGWGGTVRGLRRDAVAFARAGFLAVAFDYRGWGNSDPRVILAERAPAGKPPRFNAEVIAIREVIDPVEQTRDWLNAMHWLQSEAMCDTDRIGIWGSSYSGGHVLYVAAHDRRSRQSSARSAAWTRDSSSPVRKAPRSRWPALHGGHVANWATRNRVPWKLERSGAPRSVTSSCIMLPSSSRSKPPAQPLCS